MNERPKPAGPSSRRPDLDTFYTINADGSRNFLHPADVSGRWQVRKNIVFAILIVIYIVLPWIRVNGAPAIWIDIPHRAAYLFGRTFTNQDFYLMFFLVSGMGFALFVLTALWGRIWCGFACPQTVWLEGVFRRLERWLEGKREVRIRRNQAPANFDKIWRKGVKHLLFVALSIFTAHLFLAYFIPVRELLQAMAGPPSEHRFAFGWMAVMSAILYFDFAWFREQVCLVVCPYGRLQSVLVDGDSKLVGYDRQRGEPRGRAGEAEGDCIDCGRCVVVCPTGIDIRNGLQMECVGCGNCIDACDEVMDRVGRPRGLVRYDSQRGFETGGRRPFFRPRVFLYAALGLLGLTVATVAGGRRTTFEVRALRSPGMPYILDEETLRNMINVDVQNKENVPRTYFVEVVSPPGGPAPQVVLPQPRLHLQPLSDQRVVAVATLPLDQYREPIPIRFAVRDSVSGEERAVVVKFLGP